MFLINYYMTVILLMAANFKEVRDNLFLKDQVKLSGEKVNQTGNPVYQ